MWGDNNFINKGSVPLEYRNTVGRTVTHVEKTIIGQLCTMDRGTELLWWGLSRPVTRSTVVRRLVTICAPEALHFPSVSIDDCYTTIEVAVRDINLIFCGIGEDYSDSSEVVSAQATILGT